MKLVFILKQMTNALYSDCDCAFMVVHIKNQKVALTSITLWFTSKESPLQFTTNTILFNRAEVAALSKDLAINFEIERFLVLFI